MEINLDYNLFGSRLRGLRQKRGLLQKDLADSIGVTKSLIGMYERGERQPSHQTIQKVADYFNVSIDYLIGKSEVTTTIEVLKREQDLEKFLLQNPIFFKGELLDDKDKQRIHDVLFAMFFDRITEQATDQTTAQTAQATVQSHKKTH